MIENYTLRDAGENLSHMGDGPGPRMEKFYPQVNFEVEQLPEIAMWKVGEKYTLVIEVIQKSHRIDDTDKDVKETAGFEIRKVGALNSNHNELSGDVKKKLNIK